MLTRGLGKRLAEGKIKGKNFDFPAHLCYLCSRKPKKRNGDMCIYFVFELLLFIVVILTFRSSAKVRTRWLIFFGLYFALIAGLRGYYVGNDTSGYVGYFTGTNIGGMGYGTVRNPGEFMEIGFSFIGRFLSLFSHNGTFFLLAHALFVWMAIVMFYKDRKNALWSFLLMFAITLSSSIIVINVAMRQSFSLGFVLWGFYLLRDVDYSVKRKLLRNVRFILGIVCIVFAMTVHRTSIILIPVAILLYFIRTDKKWIYYTAIIASFILSQLFMRDVGEFFDTVLATIGGVREENIALLGDRYEGSFGETASSVIRCLSYVLPCLLTTYLSNKRERRSYSFKCLIFWICFVLLFNYSHMVNRLSVLFYVIGVTSFIPEKVNKNRGYYAIYILITLYYLWRAYVGYEHWTHTDSTLPYYFFWE